MKKLLLLALIVMFTAISCKPGSDKDPLRYKRCVVVNKLKFLDGFGIKVKFTHSIGDSLDRDYDWISVPRWEWDKLNIGDTIK